jgi:hypothetical protein
MLSLLVNYVVGSAMEYVTGPLQRELDTARRNLLFSLALNWVLLTACLVQALFLLPWNTTPTTAMTVFAREQPCLNAPQIAP